MHGQALVLPPAVFYARCCCAFLLFAERPDSPLHIFKSPSFARPECSVSGQDFP
jgi:hypothetical protein